MSTLGGVIPEAATLRDVLIARAAADPATRTMPPEPRTEPEDIAVLQPTSGTSGEPRAAMVRHRNVMAYLVGLGGGLAGPDDILVAWVPPWHDLGLFRFVVGGVFFG